VAATGILCVVMFVSKGAGNQTKGKEKNGVNPSASTVDHSLSLTSQQNLKKKKTPLFVLFTGHFLLHLSRRTYLYCVFTKKFQSYSILLLLSIPRLHIENSTSFSHSSLLSFSCISEQTKIISL
jgi:hypothetical protein